MDIDFTEGLNCYTLFITKYLEHVIKQRRDEGKLREGKKLIDNHWRYEGELDEAGRACGIGRAYHEDVEHRGMFFDDKAEGVGVREYTTTSKRRGQHVVKRIEGEFRAWECFGLVTSTTCFTGSRYNQIYVLGESEPTSDTLIRKKEDAFYLDGQANKAHDLNWLDYA